MVFTKHLLISNRREKENLVNSLSTYCCLWFHTHAHTHTHTQTICVSVYVPSLLKNHPEFEFMVWDSLCLIIHSCVNVCDLPHCFHENCNEFLWCEVCTKFCIPSVCPSTSVYRHTVFPFMWYQMTWEYLTSQ